MAKRKTYTSTEVKERYNKKTYDRFTVAVYKGAGAIIDDLAEPYGSKGAYIRHLIIKDAKERKNLDISAFIGGGGTSKQK